MGVTRDFVEYMTSNAILIGAEFDKIITILVTTAILAIAIQRARKLLLSSVIEAQAHQDLNRFFAPEVAARITAATSELTPGQGELREAAILFCDIRGFTPMAMQMPPGEIMMLLADYQRRMIEVINTHGGSVDKFLGDGIMATFGAVAPSDSYAGDALRAMTQMCRAAAAWNEERRAQALPRLKFGFAVDSGPVIFGAVGDERRLEYTVIGDAVNRAAKLENWNKQTKSAALTTQATLETAIAQGLELETEPEVLPASAVDGIRSPVDLVVLER